VSDLYDDHSARPLWNDELIGVYLEEKRLLNDHIAALTAQLATAQAQAKAWEAWGAEVDRTASSVRRSVSGPGGQDSLSMERNAATYKTATVFKKLCLNRPQPVTTESLARIARVGDGETCLS
jgi:hypothetical protein